PGRVAASARTAGGGRPAGRACGPPQGAGGAAGQARGAGAAAGRAPAAGSGDQAEHSPAGGQPGRAGASAGRARSQRAGANGKGSARRPERSMLPGVTLVVRNIPMAVTQRGLLDLIDRCGFASRYDFAYSPTDFDAGTTEVLVNFVTPSDAREFSEMWNGARLTGWGWTRRGYSRGRSVTA
ncbi:unnamed protein product, partial [Prorocentrum cordatum]